MVRTDLRYTYIAKGRYWRFRHPATGDIALPGAPGDVKFHEKYALLVAKVEDRPAAIGRDTFAWLIGRYKASAEFRSLSDATQIDYVKTLDLLIGELGTARFARTTRTMIKTVRDSYSDTPRKAHKIKQMVSRLYSWADENDLVPEGMNPAKSIKKIKPKGGAKEYICWSAFEFDAFVLRAIRPMRTAVMLARYTGQRAEDIVTMTWADFQGDMIRVRQSKTHMPLDIPCHSALRVYLDSLKRDLDREKGRGILILTSVAGAPYNANSLSSAIGREVRKVAKATDFPTDRSIHGLRYMAGSDIEEAGGTVAEIESVLGHQTFKMALKYASQRLRARVATAKREAANNA